MDILLLSSIGILCLFMVAAAPWILKPRPKAVSRSRSRVPGRVRRDPE